MMRYEPQACVRDKEKIEMQDNLMYSATHTDAVFPLVCH